MHFEEGKHQFTLSLVINLLFIPLRDKLGNILHNNRAKNFYK